MKTRALTTALLLTAFLPVIHWYASRLGDGSGEPLGLLALILSITLTSKKRQSPNLRFAELSLLLYAVGIFFLPPLLRTIPALATIAFLTGMHRQAGQFGLLLLSLPIQASLDFFLGYPFRLITAEGAHHLINLLGCPVQRLGVQLSLHGTIVSVDPPCSGLQMLWATAFLTALLAALFQLTYRRTILLSLIALALCLLANLLRAATLFFPEAGLIQLPGFAHEGIGLLFFALAGFILTKLARKFQHRTKPESRQSNPITRRFLTLAAGVSLVTFLPARTITSAPQNEDLSLTSYDGRPVEQVALSPREQSFAQGFPGRLKIYRVGQDTLILRTITKASRMLHPSYHCLKAEGFTIRNSQLHQNEQGHQSLTYHATRNHEAFHVTERIRSLTNHRQWTEVSAWYWHALFHPNSGPWEAETLMTPISTNHD